MNFKNFIKYKKKDFICIFNKNNIYIIYCINYNYQLQSYNQYNHKF